MKTFNDLNKGNYLYIKDNNIIEAKLIINKSNSICGTIIFEFVNGELLWFYKNRSYEKDFDSGIQYSTNKELFI